MTSSNHPREIWNRLARWWDDVLGEGNDFQRELIMPATDRLLALSPGQTVLDVACGNGNYSRRLARGGAHVIAVDFSEVFLKCAGERTTDADGSIEYRLLDATDEAALLTLGQSKFDAIVCSMAMMDMSTIDPLLRAARFLLKPAGRFVFSLPHPCFNADSARMTAELRTTDGQPEQVFGVHIEKYILPESQLSAGLLNQPEPHPLFHRPLSVVLQSCFAAGFVLDGLEEPTFPATSSVKNPFSWKKRPQIPPAIVLRLRPV